jgi:hypothetical protein
MKLHQRLGKPIPSTDPVLVAAEATAAKKAAAAANGSAGGCRDQADAEWMVEGH